MATDSFSDKNLRTYTRRETTRRSGFHTCEETTGGECRIVRTQKCLFPISGIGNQTIILRFRKDNIGLNELFEKNWGLLAWGGYIKPSINMHIDLSLSYIINKDGLSGQTERTVDILAGQWAGLGIHEKIEVVNTRIIDSFEVIMKISYSNNSSQQSMEFLQFDMGSVDKQEYLDDKLYISFTQNTEMYIPSIYYFDSILSIETYLDQSLLPPFLRIVDGEEMVLKSCNRCGRYLPINIYDELRTLDFSNHCKKRAPCTHSTFRAYSVQNYDAIKPHTHLILENGKVVTYYGHQLECKVCKKYFVNAPLNPQRNAQQFKEDGLRRRAIEVLVNFLLRRNLVHFEFERRTKHEFSKFIWERFGKKCFKCGKELKLEEMALDHTMPLAYLYRLDETATCLCDSHNSSKSDNFPVDFYTEDELRRLSEITGLSLELLHSRSINMVVLNLLVEHVEWFFDDFLMTQDYQKVRDGIRTADKINDSLRRVISGKVDLIDEYRKRTGRLPSSVTLYFV